MKPSRDSDLSHAEYLRRRPARHRGYERTSRYLEMRDGTRIAVDICLPRGLGATRAPTIVRQTRYFRRFRVHPALRRWLGETTLDPMNAPMRRLFTSRGYAWVDVDVRGSGASFGERPCPWYLDGEVADGVEIVDFITRQPWSNGRVGSTGVSYEGTTADFLAVTGHPAVRAIAPRFALWDVFSDVAFPGGLHNSYFTRAWTSANASLDRNAPGEMVALIYMLQAHGMLEPRWAERIDRPAVEQLLSRFITWGLGGVAPVDGDEGQRRLIAALASHADNYDVHGGALTTTYRDDSPPDSKLVGQTSDYFSPHTYVDRLGDVAVLSYGGWFDGAYANAAIKRHHALTARGLDSQLLIGPWIHGGQLDLDPDAPGLRATFDHAAELLRFFDRHLLPDEAVPATAPVRTYVMGEGCWRESKQWPPTGTRALALGFAPGRRLVREQVESGVDVSRMSLQVGSGKRTRWRTLLCPFLRADGLGRSDRGYSIYESAALDADLVVAGHPILELTLESSTADGAIIAYLEDVTGSGSGRLLSEGELRTVHRTRLVEHAGAPPTVEASFARSDELSLEAGQRATHAIELLPLAHRFPRGHRVRLLLAAADVDHFTTPAASQPVEWRIELARSRLLLPVTAASAGP